MQDAGDSSIEELRGTLRWNEFEGGFWSLELDQEHPVCGRSVVLNSFDAASDFGTDTKVVVRGVPRPEVFGFQMAGVHFDVESVRAAN